jgi:hypothetical protein
MRRCAAASICARRCSTEHARRLGSSANRSPKLFGDRCEGERAARCLDRPDGSARLIELVVRRAARVVGVSFASGARAAGRASQTRVQRFSASEATWTWTVALSQQTRRASGQADVPVAACEIVAGSTERFFCGPLYRRTAGAGWGAAPAVGSAARLYLGRGHRSDRPAKARNRLGRGCRARVYDEGYARLVLLRQLDDARRRVLVPRARWG